MQDSVRKPALFAAFWFALPGLLWVTISDWALTTLVRDFDLLLHSTYLKSWISVLGAGCVFFFVMQTQLQARLKTAMENGRLYEAGRQAEQKRREAETALKEQEQFYRLVAEHATDLVILFDQHLVPRFVSPSCQGLLGYAPPELLAIGKQIAVRLVHPDDLDSVRVAFEKLAERRAPLFLSCRVRRRDGEYVWMEMAGVLIQEATGNPAQYRVSVRDITERRRFEEKLSHQAFHDGLTGLPNRLLFLNRLDHALTRAERRQQRLAVLFLDLDGFKIVNDSLGHDAGDQLLVDFGKRLQECVRAGDTLARLGGDEFTILLEPADGAGDAVRVAGRIAEALRPPFLVGEHEVFVAASIGIVLAHPGEYAEPGALLRNADAAMYRAKAKGKGRYELFDPRMNQEDMEHLELETDLRHAVERGELRVYYQPIVNLMDGRILGLEALVRWMHPQRGLLGPIQFIPLAEETGLILPVGRWVLREACRQLQEWHQRYALPEGFHVSVNVSARQFQQQDVVERVRQHLAATGLDPCRLQLEITESATMEDSARSIDMLTRLKALGVRLAVDDFGTGYSSLRYVKRFPLDVLKIDRSFVSGLDATDEVILRAITAVGRTLNLELVAEGVETAEQAEYLIALGCQQGQGFHYFRPLPPAAVEPLLWTTATQQAADQTASAD